MKTEYGGFTVTLAGKPMSFLYADHGTNHASGFLPPSVVNHKSVSVMVWMEEVAQQSSCAYEQKFDKAIFPCSMSGVSC